MQVNHAEIPRPFVPVTLTLDTPAEVNMLADLIGSLTESDAIEWWGAKDCTYAAYVALNDVANEGGYRRPVGLEITHA